jgi:Xaa-Pro aminopeptidase
MAISLNGADALLMIGDSERDADLYYATGFRAPDPFIFLWTPTAKLLIASDLETDRAKDQAQVDTVLALSVYAAQLTKDGNQAPSRLDILLALLNEHGLQSLQVPTDFPLQTADQLRHHGIELQIAPSPLFPQRQIKSSEEISALRQALKAAEYSMEAGIELIRQAQVQDQALYLDGTPLSSERVRRRIHQALLEKDCIGRHTIVAGGEQGCDPHQEGSGPLWAGQPIIIDIFPQDAHSGYYGDITRTVVKGSAPAAVRQLFEAVHRGQQLALGQVRAGADGSKIHQAVQDLFSQAGYKTGQQDGFIQGFFHGTGHGLGLEIHEAPRLGRQGDILQEGHVVTVEPGLYYRGLGGIRLEDVVVVEAQGCQNLTTFPIYLEV